MAPAIRIRALAGGELPSLERRVAETWGSAVIASRGHLHRLADLECVLAVDADGRWLGVAAWRMERDGVELVLLEAFERGAGAGSALLEAAIDSARAAGAGRVWLVTTNDNTAALGFYQRRGFSLVAVHRDAVTEARRTIKPEIPLFGEDGIPIRDEIELERRL